MTRSTRSSFRFIAYVALLAAGMVYLAAHSFGQVGNSYSDDLGLWVALTVIFTMTEVVALTFYDEKVRWGLSSGEAILLPMITALSGGQVITTAAVAVAVMRRNEWTRTPIKEAFNVSEYGLAAGVSALLWSWTNDSTGLFTVQNALAATMSVVAFAALTHVFVAVGFHLAGRGSVLDALREVAPAALWNLAGNVILGLFLAAALGSARWTVLLFPLPLAALYFGYRAVVSQDRERERVERLHAASQVLAGAPDLSSSLKSFLVSVAEMVSAQEAMVLLDNDHGVVWSAVRGSDLVTDMADADEDSLGLLMQGFQTGASPLLHGKRLDANGLLTATSPEANMIAVPLLVDDMLRGCLVVQERTGAGEFDDADARLLRALANELSLAISSRQLAEEVSAERERFRLMVEAVKDYAIFMLDPKGRVMSWNEGAQRIKGYEAEEIIGQHVSRFYPHDTPGDWETELQMALAEGTSEVEGWRVRKDGSRFLAQVLMSPVWDSNGRLQGYAKVVRDITERMEAIREKESLQSQLHQAQKLETVGRLAGGIAHDFNNLLSVMLNYSRFVMDAVKDDPAVLEDVSEIKRAAERAASLTRQLLIFSRREIPKPQVIDINTVITGVEKLLKRSMGTDMILRTELQDDPAPVKVDAGQLEQVLLNLAINARDAMTGGGTITIRTSIVELDDKDVSKLVGLDAGPHVRLEVSDTGSGMSPEVQERVFEPFFTTKPKEMGTGLGLATVYGIIQQSSAHIGVASAEGMGTTFTIHIPVTDEAIEVPASERVAPSRGRGETVLVVEDQSAVRTLAGRILSGHGYRVKVAANGVEALEKAGNGDGPVSLLLSDVVMPHMSGIELGEKMAELVPGLKVLYMSGYNDAMVPNGATASDDAPLLQKPFTEDELLLKVREVLDS